MSQNCLVITAADAKFFDLAQGCIQSVRAKPEGQRVPFAFFDLGCTEEQRTWLHSTVDFVRQPDWDFSFPNRPNAPTYLRGLLARPFLRRYFPDYEVYLWIDADAWVQDWRPVELFLEGARRRRGMAVVPEIDRGSQLQYGGLPHYWNQVQGWYALAYGQEVAKELCSFPMLNAGVFALHQDAPHWKAWEKTLGDALQRTVTNITDQIALNFAIYRGGLFNHTELLPAWCNWTCHYGLPRWDENRRCLVEPYLPDTPIGILHLTVQKHDQVRVMTTAGKEIDIRLRYPSGPVPPVPSPPIGYMSSVVVSAAGTVATVPSAPAETVSPDEHDYTSPGLALVRPDRFFPNMTVGNKSSCTWPYLRREIPHLWYVDRRVPTVGFLNRDEAAILYNTAFKFRGQPALEIGCWLGWSACHLALAGVLLDVIDPVLERHDFRASVTDSLTAAGALKSVNLVAGSSPEKVHQLAAHHQRKWSLFFIDGDHEGEAPLQDSIACEPYATQDAVVLFHDLTAPAVAKGLDYFRARGWHTMVYQTMQIMGVAWRGKVQPVEHFPDPGIFWQMPAHLQQHPVSGWPKDANPDRARKEFAELVAAVRPFTSLSELRLASLYNLARHVCLNDLPGNFVECGAWRGGASALLAYVIKHYSRRLRRLFSFDTFAGMPEPTAVDKHQGIPANDTPFGAGTLKAPRADFLDIITARLDVCDIVPPVRGLFQETLPRTRDEIGPIALLHADGDWYTSTMDVLNNLFDPIVPGGFLQIDDYGHWEGCKKAVHDFERQRGLAFLLNALDYTGVWLRKD